MKGYSRSILVFLLTIQISLMLQSCASANKQRREYYQLTTYHFSTPDQEKIIDNYLKSALLPALHKMEFKNIGVFKNKANDTLVDKTIYVLMSLRSLDDVVRVTAMLNADSSYQNAGADYIRAVYNTPPYTRIETVLLHAFPLAPTFVLPELKGPRKERVYELRSYESATEKIFQNKVKMFNEGDEIGLFKRLNFNATFYGEVIAGSKMPNLMYMTCHEDTSARRANWKAFVDDPQWIKLKSMPEYKDNVSHIDIYFLYPTDYSDY